MAKYLDKWKTDFPASVGNVTRPTDGIDDTLDFNSDGFPQRISSDPVHYKLENDMASQLFSNDARLHEGMVAIKTYAYHMLTGHDQEAQSHANGIAGNAASATKLKTARRINVIGDCLTGKAASFDGSDNADIEVTLATALKALGGLSPSVDKLPYFTGANAASLASLSEFMRGVLGKATAAEVRTAIGAINEPGVGVIAGDVSNANAWWVKLSGAIPLIIQNIFLLHPVLRDKLKNLWLYLSHDNYAVRCVKVSRSPFPYSFEWPPSYAICSSYTPWQM